MLLALLRALCCARLCASLAPNLVPCVDLLTRAATTTRSSPSRPDAREVTAALAELSNAGAHPDSWAAALESDDRSSWRPVFSAKPEALKAAAKAARVGGATASRAASAGKYLSVPGGQTFRWAADGGEFANTVRVFGGALELSFAGSFSMVGRRMTLVFQRLRVRLFWLLKLRGSIFGRAAAFEASSSAFVAAPRPPKEADSRKGRASTRCYADASACASEFRVSRCGAATADHRTDS